MSMLCKRLAAFSVLTGLIPLATFLSFATSSVGYGQDATVPAPIFVAPFDTDSDALTPNGPCRILTAASLKREQTRVGNHHAYAHIKPQDGKFGGYLHFSAKSNQVLFYPAQSLPLFQPDDSFTFSFWLRLTPDEDLAPGFCDPLQITSKAWNDAAIWVDFDKELPRTFRMGAFPDYSSWNPQDTPFEQIPDAQRPLIPVPQPPFRRDAWTHVVMTIEGVNRDAKRPGTARLYLNGKLQGESVRPIPLSWTPQDTVLMIGINYVGDFDELAIFDVALSPAAVKGLYSLQHSLAPRDQR